MQQLALAVRVNVVIVLCSSTNVVEAFVQSHDHEYRVQTHASVLAAVSCICYQSLGCAVRRTSDITDPPNPQHAYGVSAGNALLAMVSETPA